MISVLHRGHLFLIPIDICDYCSLDIAIYLELQFVYGRVVAADDVVFQAALLHEPLNLYPSL